MILFVSDIHFGRGSQAEERASEAALVACLRAYEDVIEHLYLVGDVFDEYIEYHALIPKGFVRFQALLAAWTDRGVPVTYLVGNHDPWHRSYFEDELGVRVIFDDLTETAGGYTIYLRHGDGIGPKSLAYRWLKPVLRHPLPVWLYRSLLPGDSGFRLARWVNRRFGGRVIQPSVGRALRRHAQHILAETSADLVVMGHSHRAEVQVWPDGTYLNPGCWHLDRTFAGLDADGPKLLQWNGAYALAVDREGPTERVQR